MFHARHPVPGRLMVLLVPLVAMSPARANLNAELDSLFGTLVNVTEPSAHLGPRRGVLSGGSIVSRNRLVNVNPISIVPPSFEAGCGGINLFGGSFSFINAEQFTNLLRGIASNAAGYAFNLALTTMFPSGAEIIEQLQKKIAQLNALSANSCQLAQGLVNDTASALTGKQIAGASLMADLHDFGDVFENRTTANAAGQGPLETVYANAPAEAARQFEGNLVWKALTDQSAHHWYAHGDQDLLEMLMSLTGSLIVGSAAGGLQPSPEGGLSLPTTTLEATLSVSDLLNGSGTDAAQTVLVWRCASLDECRSPTKESVTLEGLIPRVRNLLIGDVSGAGLIQKFMLGVEDLTAEEKGFLEHAPWGLGGAIRTLARQEPGMAFAFAERAAPIIAIELVQIMVRDMLKSVRLASAGLQHTHSTQWRQQLEAVRADIWSEYDILAARYGNPNDLLESFRTLLALYKAPSYLDVMQANGTQGDAED
ncbi:conjugal transfer protein TraH [Thiocystis violacea]|uniref:conjugal transfer protein TraH n=1 Tax=Thiocystis violacea TaxID=13725 RepID=UPI0019041994|nr:conjugal transfer protein TraH [Thiocystis violacea]MBK1718618.1 conjugal transfer protein TraH [Thiocystis violacea]